MNKLLSAGFARLWKSRLFYLEIVISCGLAAIASCTQFREVRNWGAIIPLEHAFFNCTPFILFFAPSFIALFTGSEYSDGTIRNKLIVGNTRFDVYLSEFIVNSAAMLIVYMAQLIVAFALGLPMFGFFTVPITEILLQLFDAVLMVIGLSALFTMLTLLISSKSGNAVICLVLVCVLFVVGMMLQSALYEPEINANYMTLNDEGQVVMGEPYPNPRYISGVKRQVYQFIFDFIPMGQAIHVADLSFAWYYSLYSLSLIAITTVPGLLLFRRKDIK